MQNKLSTCPHEKIFQIIKDAVFESEREVDDLHIEEHDAQSVDRDNLFQEKKTIKENELEE